MTSVPTIELNDGVRIPQLGFGVFQIKPDETAEAVKRALDIGYRHIDTAEMYGNEKEVGQGVRDAGLDRADVFITSKLNNGFHKPDDARRAFDKTLEALGSDYVDLFLIHWPTPAVGDFVETWHVLEEFAESGRARAIGTSNFHQHHLDRIAAEGSVTPAVDQIEVYPYLTQEPLRGYLREHAIATEVWSPLGSGTVLGDETLARVAAAHGVSPAQATIRWHLQRGDIVFPKSTHRERLAQNLDVLGFTLTDEEMAAITGLNRDLRTGPDPDHFNWVPRG